LYSKEDTNIQELPAALIQQQRYRRLSRFYRVLYSKEDTNIQELPAALIQQGLTIAPKKKHK